MPTLNRPVQFALIAATMYALSAPLSKLLLFDLPPTLMAGLLYFGAGLGMSVMGLVRKNTSGTMETPLGKEELPFVAAMVGLDILAPISLMIGLKLSTAANASLLNNFEIVSTALIALLLFHEAISKRLWIGIGLITLSSAILSISDVSSFRFSFGSLFVLLACLFWGLENNCTRKLSQKDPLQIVMIKGLGSGLGSLLIGFVVGERLSHPLAVLAALLLGFVSYGFSVFLYVHAQRHLGAAKTSAYYAVAPFIGVILSFLFLHENLPWTFFIALVIMIGGAYFASTDGVQQ